MNRNHFIAPALIFSLSVVLATLIVALTLKNIKKADQTINTTGSAKKVIVSDLGILKGTIMIEGQSPVEGYQSLQAQKPKVIAYLKSQGFSEDKIDFQTSNQYANYLYNNNGQQVGIRSYTVSQSLRVESKDVDKVKAVSLDMSSLIEQGVNFTVGPPEYHYTKIGEIKVDIQAAAATDAMVRGKRIAEATGRKLGALRTARMGVIQITPENSNMVSDQGINDISSIRKEITAVVSAEFSID